LAGFALKPCLIKSTYLKEVKNGKKEKAHYMLPFNNKID
jgi:hypothetical protein